MTEVSQHLNNTAVDYFSLFADSIDPIILTTLTGNIVAANESACRFFECDQATLIGKKIQELHAPDAQLPLMSSIEQEKITVFDSRIMISPDKEAFHMTVYARRIQQPGGQKQIQWIHHDISQKVALETMQADLVAMLFHDLQTPLGNVMSALAIVQQEIKLDTNDILTMMLDIAVRNADRLEILVKSLLDINRLEAGLPVRDMDQTDLETLIDDVQETERPLLEGRNLQLKHTLPASLPSIYAARDMIRRVLVNLVDNAIKYSQQGQTIWLKVEPVPKATHLHISVIDQGPGVPLPYRQVIFEKFRRIQGDTRQGFGLGLAFCRLVVEAHNGRIWVDDAPDGGARFNFTIPIYQVNEYD